MVTDKDALIIDSWSVIALYLCQPGDTRSHLGSEFICGNYKRKASAVRQHVRPRANDAHISKQDINELGKLVDVCPAKQPSDPCDPVIVLLGLFFVGFFIYDHRPKL